MLGILWGGRRGIGRGWGRLRRRGGGGRRWRFRGWSCLRVGMGSRVSSILFQMKFKLIFFGGSNMLELVYIIQLRSKYSVIVREISDIVVVKGLPVMLHSISSSTSARARHKRIKPKTTKPSGAKKNSQKPSRHPEYQGKKFRM